MLISMAGVMNHGIVITITVHDSIIPEFNVSLFYSFDNLFASYHLCSIFFVADIEAECQDDYMKIRIGFNGSFTGLLYSAGKQIHRIWCKATKCAQVIEMITFRVRIKINFFFSCVLCVSFRHSLQGYAYDPDCMYINGSGRDYYEFFIQLNRCGTLGKNAISEKSRENPTVNLSFVCLFVFS